MMTDPDTAAAARVAPALTPAMEKALMERHRAALEMADVAVRRPMALAALCEVALSIASAATVVGAAAQRGESHPLGVYIERPAKVITAKNGGNEIVLVGIRLDSEQAVECINAVAALRRPADDGTVEADPESPIPGVPDEAPAPAPGLRLVEADHG